MSENTAHGARCTVHGKTTNRNPNIKDLMVLAFRVTVRLCPVCPPAATYDSSI